MPYDTLKLNKEFRRLYGRGKSAVSPSLVMYIRPRKGDICRIGITTGKKVGNAVKRNRARRVIRAAFRSLLPVLPGAYDIVFVARGKTPFVKSTQVEADMRYLFRKVGIQLRDPS